MRTRKVHLYDTTLRDGAQAEDVSFSLEDKLRITKRLDEFGVHYIEGGWPGANPKDAAFFEEAGRLALKSARLTAFGSTRRAKRKASADENLRALVRAGTEVVTLFGKSWDLHVRDALRVSLKDNLEMIGDSVRYLKKNVEEVFYDAEHFFDGYVKNQDYAMATLKAAVKSNADCVVLCDTNGGMLTLDLVKIVRAVQKALPGVRLGIHVHNDSETAAANTIAAVAAGVRHVQGTVNGLGERCGNANLCSIIPSLQLKLGLQCVPEENLAGLRALSRFVSELANMPHWKHQPFVGDSAFAHKGGVHVSAILRNPLTYEHIRPELVGNRQRVLVSDLSGRANILQKAAEFGIDLKSRDPKTLKILEHLKDLESRGFQFEGAEASFELLIKKVLGTHRRFFELKGARVIVEKRREREEAISEATIKVAVDGKIEHTAAEGKGPVHALDGALRKALHRFYPKLRDMELIDYKVRVLTTVEGTAAPVRVLIESGDRDGKWGTVGVSANLIEASWQALVDAIEYKLLKDLG
ncbi:citramalate synthase [Candidatus Moduliflexota bacterium]